ncbi:glycosyltransferase family A protein [uncultured Winogradskyella sp.]|uniref:glycosyltransferase family 2 protein n=1 Tax=uncultured Winogradskyella sp. TaxID=395353 RepID=UPI002616A851|nr:glycosyltransferase family A protein [uncultured Winogradskyella sp.]
MNSLVSVIIPVFNRENFIYECLESILKQTYRPIEVILVDDGSTDNSISLIKKYIKENSVKDIFDIRLFQQKNSGAPKARNKGLFEAHGEYVQFFDSDDLLLPNKLEHQISIFNKNIDIVYSKTQVFLNNRDCLVEKFWGRELTGEYIDYFEFPWQTMCALYRRNYLISNNIVWNEDLKMHQDWEFSMQHVIQTDKIVFLNEVNSLYRSHDYDRIGLNLSTDKLKSIEDALFSIYKKLEDKKLVSSSLKFLYFKRLSFCFYKYGLGSYNKEKRAVWERMYYIRKDLSLVLWPLLWLNSLFFKIFRIVYKE